MFGMSAIIGNTVTVGLLVHQNKSKNIKILYLCGASLVFSSTTYHFVGPLDRWRVAFQFWLSRPFHSFPPLFERLSSVALFSLREFAGWGKMRYERR